MVYSDWPSLGYIACYFKTQVTLGYLNRHVCMSSNNVNFNHLFNQNLIVFFFADIPGNDCSFDSTFSQNGSINVKKTDGKKFEITMAIITVLLKLT